jgi:hypothetical protein
MYTTTNHRGDWKGRGTVRMASQGETQARLNGLTGGEYVVEY